jgi:predicted RNase H-like HicB family nuclease
MKFPIAIEPGDDKRAFGVVVPDLPGCFSAGDTLDEAFAGAREAIELWISTTLDDGGAIPATKSLAKHRAKREFKGWIWGVVDVDILQFDGPAERINITLPRRVLAAIDRYAKRNGESRSGFLARAALDGMRKAG